MTVDQGTGTVTLRAVFPNPKHDLLPGMFVRAILEEGVNEQGMLVPQQGVTHDARGNATALGVGRGWQGGAARPRIGRCSGDKWVVKNGLKVGDQLIVDGLQKVRPGAPAQAVSWTTSRLRRHPPFRPPSSKEPHPMSRFFIDRPIFAWVIAIVIMMAGLLSIIVLPIAQYPAIAPPAISITGNYPGASAQTVEDSVTQVIEQKMNGIDGLRYMASSSDSSGAVNITLTFENGTNPDIAQVQVQNKLQLAMPLLPQEVQQQGLKVAKSTKNFLMVMAFVSEDGSMTQFDLADYVAANVLDTISRVKGVGDVTMFGAQYAMRIWLDPAKLNGFKLTPIDVINAMQAQNAQVSARAAGRYARRPRAAAQRHHHGAKPFANARAIRQDHSQDDQPTARRCA